MKVLILHPEFQDPGGVSNYFASLKNRFEIQTKHFAIGKRVGERRFSIRIFRLFCDYVRFIKLLKGEHYDIVHINPSLDFKSVMRDALFILIAKCYKRKVIIFFHGWSKQFEKNFENNLLWIFRQIYNMASAFIVLADEFRRKFRALGFKQPVYLTTTAVEDNLLRKFNVEKVIKKRMDNNKYRILFLARILKEKGVYETVNAVKLLQSKYSNIELVIAGDGKELQSVKNYVKKNNVSNAIFAGYVKGKEKGELFENSYIYCFPTYYAEGIPCSVLEAMAFGLPVITRPVGGIADFFEDGKHGFITKSRSSCVFAGYIEKLILDKNLYKKISLFNYKFAQERFLASKVIKKIERIYEEVNLRGP